MHQLTAAAKTIRQLVCDYYDIRLATLLGPCWQLTLRERLRLLFTGKLWHQVYTFGQSLQPQLLTLDAPFTPADIEAARLAKATLEEQRAWHEAMLEKYGKRCALKILEYNRRGYHPNDRRRSIVFEPDDFKRASELGIFILMGCRICNDQHETALPQKN